MCIIIWKKPGIELKEEWMDNSAKNNPHGFGLCFLNKNTGELEVHKTLEYEAFKLIYQEVLFENPESDILLHFRKNTCGETTEENCHPFIVNDRLVMMHNGSIKPCEPTQQMKNAGEKRSDTKIFNDDMLRDLPDGWQTNETIKELIEFFIGESKLAIMDGDGQVHLFNDHLGHWKDDLWLSNYSYYPNTRSLQKHAPAYWTANVDRDKISVTKIGENFFRWIKGDRYRWSETTNGWRKCDIRTDEFKFDGSPIIKDTRSPVFAYQYSKHTNAEMTFNDVYDTKKEGDQKQLPFQPQQHQERQKKQSLGECDWCGKVWHRDHLEVVACTGKDGVQDISLMCNRCSREFYSDSTGMLHGLEVIEDYDIDTLLDAQLDYSY